MRSTAYFAFVTVVLLNASCSSSDGDRYRISGEAFFDGRPIPYGDVLFTPDDAAKNSGPQGIAQIRDGRFDTSGSDGKGIAGGPTVIRVTGLSAPGGKLLCEFEYRVDLPRSSSTLRIDVPVEAAPRKPGGGPEI